MYDALAFIGKDAYTMADVMGLSSHAFRMTIHEQDVSAAGPTMYAPAEIIQRPLKHLGYDVEEIGFCAPATEQNLNEIKRFIRRHLDEGHAVIGWDLGAPEFSLIVDANAENFTYRYQCERVKYGLFYHEADMPPEPDYTHEMVEVISDYSAFNDVKLKNICVFAVTPARSVTYQGSLTSALKMALEHFEGRSPVFVPEYRHGICAYDAWIHSLENRTMDRFGLAYNTALIHDARRYAYYFFENLPNHLAIDTGLQSRLTSNYKQVTECMEKLASLFPFGKRFELHDDAIEEAIALLGKINDIEIDNKKHLLALYENLKKRA